MVRKIAIDQLPSLPQVLVKILDAVHSDQANYKSIAHIIRQDTAIATRLLSVANSSYYRNSRDADKRCDTIERALLFLGTDTVKTIVITASIKQFFSHFNQQQHQFLKVFWRRSLMSANFAQILAALTSYSSPDEAYLCGLLTNVGQLILLSNDEEAYLGILASSENDTELCAAEYKQFGTSHSELSSELVESWKNCGFMADALRYQHEPATAILDAQHLVKIINLASRLSVENNLSDKTLETANTLFGLNESLTRELRDRMGNDVDTMASNLGIDINDNQAELDAHRVLGERLSELGELGQINSTLWQATNQQALHNAIQRSLFLTFGVDNSLLFTYDPEQNLLSNTIREEQDGADNTFCVPAESGRSLISDALLTGTVQRSQEHHELNVIDRQLLSHCKASTLLCWPLIARQEQELRLGVLLIGANQQQLTALEQKDTMLSALCHEITAAIYTNRQRLEAIRADGPNAEEVELKIREAVHEASNPLSIIRNYLETLRINLGDNHDAAQGLELIKEEIDRVGNILLRLAHPDESRDNRESLNVISVIESTAQIFKDAICTTKQLSLELQLDSRMTDIDCNRGHLKQILTNLLKNAAEALPVGGNIIVSSEASVSFNGRQCVAITIQDDGPGISEEIKGRLFKPVTSTKGSGHSGLGLSIVKKLIDEMHGSIVCRSSSDSGTQFQILLPK